MNPFPLVFADWRRNRLLALVILTLVALALASGIAVISQERALRQGSARAADDFDLVIGAPGSPTQLVLSTVYLQPQAIPLADGGVLADLAQAPGLAYAAPLAFGDYWQGHPIVGTSADFVLRGGAQALREGRVFQRRGEAVVGASVPLALGATLHPQHGLHTRDKEEEEHGDAHAAAHYTVVGRLPKKHTRWDSAVLVPIEDVWAVHGFSAGHGAAAGERIGPPWEAASLSGVPAIVVKPQSVAAYALRGLFRTPRSMALFPAEVLNDLYLALGNVRDLMSFLSLATQVLVLVAALTALFVAFLARRRQFAVLRAIGADRVYVFAVIWIEVALLIGIGAIIGLSLGYAAAVALSLYLQAQTGFAMPASLGAEEFALAASIVLAGALLAILPAWQVFRRPIIAGLAEQ